MIFLGSPIEYESERNVLTYLIGKLEAENSAAIIFCNINLKGRQIDFVVASEKVVLVIEAKGYSAPLRGGVNGDWQVQLSSGRWKRERNFYQQVLNAKYALFDEMKVSSNDDISYPDAALVFSPSIPDGSAIPACDYKVKIGGLDLLDRWDGFESSANWPLNQWVEFAKQHNLEKVSSLAAAIDNKLQQTEDLINRYTKQFIATHETSVNCFVPIACDVDNKQVHSDVVASRALKKFGCFLIGQSGFGKTLCAKQMGVKAIACDHIPVFIEAKYFKGELNPLLNQEVCLMGEQSAKQLIDASRTLQRPLLIIVDGFNECPIRERDRLARCLKAMMRRYCAKLIITTQDYYEQLQDLNLLLVNVAAPSLLVKTKIANSISAITKNDTINGLLDAVKSGLEARIIGEIELLHFKGKGRFALFDAYIRDRLGKNARAGISALSCIGIYLLEE